MFVGIKNNFLYQQNKYIFFKQNKKYIFCLNNNCQQNTTKKIYFVNTNKNVVVI